jgi:hypothetical protein
MIVYFNISNAFHLDFLGSIPLFKAYKENSIIRVHESDRANIYFSLKAERATCCSLQTHTKNSSSINNEMRL